MKLTTALLITIWIAVTINTFMLVTIIQKLETIKVWDEPEESVVDWSHKTVTDPALDMYLPYTKPAMEEKNQTIWIHKPSKERTP